MQLKKLLNSAAFVALSIVISGCASIISGTNQTINITSVPDAADVKIEKLTIAENYTAFEGKTPAKATLPRKGSYLVTVSLAGYQKAQIPLDPGMNGWVWGNLLFGGLVGVVIDSSDGAANKLNPDEIKVNLVRVKTAGRDEPSRAYAVIYKAAPDGKTVAKVFPLTIAAR
ncbi:MAG: hypothetical protein JWO95_2539 [Verrucomicrobiales bacterium]|nr:hypothetical protein [Verrucomicrobiales bacterium]